MGRLGKLSGEFGETTVMNRLSRANGWVACRLRATGRLAAGIMALSLAALALWPAAALQPLVTKEGSVTPMPFAVAGFAVAGNDDGLGLQISQVVAADLERSGLFKPFGGVAPQNAEEAAKSPDFARWRPTGVQALLSGSSAIGADGQLSVQYSLWDVAMGSRLVTQNGGFKAASSNWRRIAHKIADDIYQRVTGEGGYFDTRIVYIAATGPAARRIKRLAIMDQDGNNPQILGDPRVLALTPRYSPVPRPGTSGVDITYMAYFNNMLPKVYLFNVETGRQELLGNFPGMTLAPRFSPDGNRVVMSYTVNGITEISTLDLHTRQQRQLTTFGAISTAPSYSPDGGKIAFESDRGGTSQIYVMNADGGNPQRISFGDGRYHTPVWSPRNDYIAFTKEGGGSFAIGVMRPDGSGERILSSSFHDEGPTWSPNGRVIMFFRELRYDSQGRGGGSKLMTVDVAGGRVRVVPTTTDASDPAWSPLIP